MIMMTMMIMMRVREKVRLEGEALTVVMMTVSEHSSKMKGHDASEN